MTHNVFQLSDAPRKLRPSLSIGKFHLRTEIKTAPDLTLQIAFLSVEDDFAAIARGE